MLEHKEILELKVIRVQQVHKVPQVLKVRWEILVLKEPQVHKVLKVRWEILVLKVQRDQQVLKVM
jgi:hypothetical protein